MAALCTTNHIDAAAASLLPSIGFPADGYTLDLNFQYGLYQVWQPGAAEVDTLPASNVRDPVVGKAWRAFDTTPRLDIDLGSVKTVRALALIGCNLAADDMLRWLLSTTAPGGGDVHDSGWFASGVAAGYGLALLWLPADSNCRYLRLAINAPSRAASGYVDVGRIFAGPAFVPEKSYELGWSEQWLDLSRVTTAEKSGVQYIDMGPRLREVSVNFPLLTAGERETARELDRLAGLSGQVLFIPDPSGAWAAEAIFGRVGEMTPLLKPYPSFHSKSYRIRQSL